MNKKKEHWKKISAIVADEVEVSNLGNMRQYGKILEKHIDEYGRPYVKLICRDGKTTSDMFVDVNVFENFCENPYSVKRFRFKNGDKTDCRAENIVWTFPTYDEEQFNKFEVYSRRIRLAQICKVTNKVKLIWPSTEICCKVTGYDKNAVIDCCTGKLKSYGGYRFKLLD